MDTGYLVVVMSKDADGLDDPELKAAIRSAFGAERAPDVLHQRIAGLMQQSRQATTRPSPRHASLFAWRPLVTGLAAVLAVAAAGLYLYKPAPPARTAEGRMQVLQAMVEMHDACCARESHWMAGLPENDLRLIGQAIGQQLRQEVLAADLSEDGWELKGAAICRVNGQDAAHFIFARRHARLSVFSLPVSACARVIETQMLSETIADRCVAAFTQDGRMYCMVGFCPNRNLKTAEVAELLQKHRSQMVGPGPGQAGVALLWSR
jgi:hypothetical protein